MAKPYKGLTPVEEYVLQLTRIGLYGRCEDSDILQKTIDWEVILLLSAKLNVVAVVYDGIEVLERHQRISVDCSLQEETQLKFVGYQLMYQQRYQKYMKFLSQLVGFYGSIHIPVMILKGAGLSRLWSNPSSRPIGDIDVFLFGHHKEADRRIYEQIGIEISYYPVGHHTVFHSHGETVENHFSFLSVPVISKKMRQLESDLLSLTTDYCILNMEGNECRVPSATFNAVYLMAHLSTHFLSDNISLRQLCDWTMFVCAHHDKVNWSQVTTIYRRCSLERFVGTLNHIAIMYLGMDASWVPEYVWDKKAERKILEGLFCYSAEEHYYATQDKIIANMIKSVSNRWKYHLLDASMVGAILRKGFYFMMHPGDFQERQLYS